jgi:hypothetical protein
MPHMCVSRHYPCELLVLPAVTAAAAPTTAAAAAAPTAAVTAAASKPTKTL